MSCATRCDGRPVRVETPSCRSEAPVVRREGDIGADRGCFVDSRCNVGEVAGRETAPRMRWWSSESSRHFDKSSAKWWQGAVVLLLVGRARGGRRRWRAGRGAGSVARPLTVESEGSQREDKIGRWLRREFLLVLVWGRMVVNRHASHPACRRPATRLADRVQCPRPAESFARPAEVTSGAERGDGC